jgi:copper(I)-binding protein
MNRRLLSLLDAFIQNKSKHTPSFSLFIFLLITTMNVSFVNANDHKSTQGQPQNMAESFHISDPWARATFALAKTGAAYFSANNTSDTTVILESVSVTTEIAMTAELHTTVMKDDMMQMQELSEGVQIKSAQAVEFSPGGKHIMIMGLEGPLQKGKSIVITLHFEDGSSIDHVFPILDKRN